MGRKKNREWTVGPFDVQKRSKWGFLSISLSITRVWRIQLTNESRDLLVGLDLLVKSLDILCQALELLGGLL